VTLVWATAAAAIKATATTELKSMFAIDVVVIDVVL